MNFRGILLSILKVDKSIPLKVICCLSWYLFSCVQLLDQSLQCHVKAGPTSFQIYVQPGLHNLLQPGSQAARKWRENERMKRKWRENEEIERKWRKN